MKKKKTTKQVTLTLGSSILAAAWLISGPDILSATGWHSKIIDILVWVPAMAVFFFAISPNQAFLECERRAFRRLLGK